MYGSDREIVLAAVQSHTRSLKHASSKLRADREIVLAAVTKEGSVLKYASTELRADRKIVLAALQQHAHWRQDYRTYSDTRASMLGPLSSVIWTTELRSDRDDVMAAVFIGGYALKYASAELQADRYIVWAATCISQCGWAGPWERVGKGRGVYFKYASPELRANRSFVLAAAQVEGSIAALQYVSAKLQVDPAINHLREKWRTDCLDDAHHGACHLCQRGPSNVAVPWKQFAIMNLTRDRDALGAAVGVRTNPAPHAVLNGATEVLPMVYCLLALRVEAIEAWDIRADFVASRGTLRADFEGGLDRHLAANGVV
eukprot:scaffold26588_cov69-Phaeocystis_antarctica.AAC.2